MSFIKITMYCVFLLLQPNMYASEQSCCSEKSTTTRVNNSNTEKNNIALISQYVSNNNISKIEALLKDYTFSDKIRFTLLKDLIEFANKTGSIVKHETIIALIKNGLYPTDADKIAIILQNADNKQKVFSTSSGLYGTHAALALVNDKGLLLPKIINLMINEKNIEDVLTSVTAKKNYSKGATARIIVAIKKSEAGKDNTAVITMLHNLSKDLKKEVHEIEKEDSEPRNTGCIVS